MIQYWCDLSIENFEEEVWYSIPNYVGIYEYSSLGRIKALYRVKGIGRGARERESHIMKQFLNPDGYPMIELHNNGIGKKYKVHRLLAICHIPNPENKSEINHKKGIKTDNRLSELEWSTTSENVQHAYDYLGKVTPMKGKFGKNCPNSKKIMCDTLGIICDSATEMANLLGMGISNIANVAKGKSLHSKGLSFRYI